MPGEGTDWRGHLTFTKNLENIRNHNICAKWVDILLYVVIAWLYGKAQE